MSDKTNTGKSYDSFVPSAATRDKFTAPDSTASRPNPESKEDRPRGPQQTPDTLKHNY